MRNISELYDFFLNSSGVSTDSRSCAPGVLFFALKGERFDGNVYAKEVLGKGALLAVVDDLSLKGVEGCYYVDDVLKALQELALFHRRKLAVPIIGITGSNGKTTTKELMAAVLVRKYNITATKGNLNNHIGVPLTLLSMTSDTELGIVEMGANHVGEIGFLCSISEPDYGVITNIGKAHLEGFGSYEGVIKAKGELYEFLKKNNKTLFININDGLLMGIASGIDDRYTYGKQGANEEGDIVSDGCFLSVEWKRKGEPSTFIDTQLVGSYNFNNVMCAIGVGCYFGVSENDVIDALSSYEPQNNRSQLVETKSNKVIMDAYNANPSSMELALDNFANAKGECKILILGSMKELGDESAEEHRKLLVRAESIGCKAAYLIGAEFQCVVGENSSTRCFETVEVFNIFLADNPIVDCVLLVKGSRSIGLEKILPLL